MVDISRGAARRLLSPCLAALLCAALGAPSVWANAIATRGPVPGNEAPTYLEGDLAEGGLAVLNADNVPIEFLPGYQVSTRASADDTTGELRGSAGFALAANTSAPLPQPFFDSFVFGSAVLGGTPGSVVPVTLTMDVHGRFASTAGSPSLGLEAFLWALNGSGGPSYGSQLEFLWPTGSGAVQTFAAGYLGSDTSAAPFAGGLPSVISIDPANLMGQARISFDWAVGQVYDFQASLGGGAEPPRVAGVAQAAAGNTDAWGTGLVRLSLPEGVTLLDATGLMASATVTSAVPEPASAVLLLLGLGLVAGLGRRGGGVPGLTPSARLGAPGRVPATRTRP